MLEQGRVGDDEKLGIDWATDYGHTMATSLILCGLNSNPNPKKYLWFGYNGLVFVEIMAD